MKMKNLVGYLLIAFFVAGLANYFVGAERKEAHVTVVVRDVSVLAKNAQHAAVVNDLVGEGNAVRTGGESRAELTFTDQTLARIGANSVFSFGAGGKEFDLGEGAMLLAAPKSAGTVKVNTAAVTAAVSGFTALFESHKKDWSKFIVLEGEACVRSKSSNGPCTTLHPGEMLLFRDGKFTSVKQINLEKTVRSAGLINKFPKLPNWSLTAIQTVVNNQGSTGGQAPGGYYNDQGGNNATYERNNTQPANSPRQPPPPASPPPTPPIIPSPPG